LWIAQFVSHFIITDYTIFTEKIKNNIFIEKPQFQYLWIIKTSNDLQIIQSASHYSKNRMTYGLHNPQVIKKIK